MDNPIRKTMKFKQKTQNKKNQNKPLFTKNPRFQANTSLVKACANNIIKITYTQ